MNKLAAAAVVWIPMVGLVSTQAVAEGWFWQSGARVFAEQNDNVYLSSNAPVDAASIGVAANSTVSLESETRKIALTPRLLYRHYSSDQDLDHGNASLGVDMTQVMERTQVGIKGSVGRDTTLKSELEDSGNLQTKIDINQLRVDPYLRYKMTPLSGIKLGLGFRAVDYIDGEEQGYFDYDQVRAELAYEWDLSRRDQLSATVFATDYTSDALFNDTKSTGVQLGWQHRFTDNTGALVSAGAYNLDAEFQLNGVGYEDSSTGSLFKAELTHNAPLTRYTLGASSTLDPSSLGIVRKNMRLDGVINHSFTERFSGRFSGLALRAESTDDRFVGDDRDYYAIDTSLAWRLDALWRLRAGYRYASQQYDAEEDSADSSRVSVSLEYNSLKHNFR